MQHCKNNGTQNSVKEYKQCKMRKKETGVEKPVQS